MYLMYSIMYCKIMSSKGSLGSKISEVLLLISWYVSNVYNNYVFNYVWQNNVFQRFFGLQNVGSIAFSRHVSKLNYVLQNNVFQRLFGVQNTRIIIDNIHTTLVFITHIFIFIIFHVLCVFTMLHYSYIYIQHTYACHGLYSEAGPIYLFESLMLMLSVPLYSIDCTGCIKKKNYIH